MIKKQTWLNISDGTTVQWLQTFHLYKGFFRKTSYTGNFIKGSAKIVTAPRLEYKGFKFKYNTKGNICRVLIVRVQKGFASLDGSLVFFRKNNGVLIKKKQNLKSKYLYGPIEKNIKRKKIKAFYKKIL